MLIIGAAAWLFYSTRPRPPWPMYQQNATHNAVMDDGFPAVKWQVPLKAKVNAGLAFDGRYVYTDDFAGELVAIDARTGRLVWRQQLDNVLMSTPVVSSDKIFVGSGSNHIMWDGVKDTLWARRQGDRQYAFDRFGGRRLWSYHVRGEAMPSAAFARDGLYFATGDGKAYALNAQTGKLLWARPLRGISTMASAMVDGDNAFFVTSMGKHWRHKSDQNHVVAVNLASGKIVWVSSFGNADCAVTIAGGRVYVEGTRDVYGALEAVKARSVVVALDERTGALRWLYTSAPGLFNNVASNERAIAGVFYDGTYYQSIPATHEFAAFAADDGTVRWRVRTSAAVKMSAVVHDGRVYFGDVAGAFYVLDAKNGKRLKIMFFPRYFTTSPPIIAGKTLMVVNDRTVLAIPLSAL